MAVRGSARAIGSASCDDIARLEMKIWNSKQLIAEGRNIVDRLSRVAGFAVFPRREGHISEILWSLVECHHPWARGGGVIEIFTLIQAAFLKSRTEPSFTIVYPATYSRQFSSNIFLPGFPITAANSPS